MDVDEQPQTIFSVPIPVLPSTSATITLEDSYDDHREQHTPIIIDNGATTLRWGFSTWPSPNYGPNVIAKFKERRTNKPLLLFGESLDVESGARTQARYPWEGDVLLNFDALENALDFGFTQLGIDADTLGHPLFMTERISSPLHSRALTSELLFELYSAPSVTYGLDGIMSFYQNTPQREPFASDGLVVSFNTASTSVIPILNGKGIMSHAKRIPWGPLQASEYLLKLIQLKYPNFPTRVTSIQSNWMLQNFCDFSVDYPALLKSFRDPLNLRANERIIQFPFGVLPGEEKSQEELDKLAEKRKEQGKKLQEMAAKMRQEKLLQKENDLQTLLALREESATTGRREWQFKLEAEGFNDDEELDETIKKLENDIKKARKKDAVEVNEPEETPSFPLLDVPDADLDDEGLKEKRKQKLMKAGLEARERARKEKEREKEEKEKEERLEEEERDTDLEGWTKKRRTEHEGLMNKIKERERRKAALSDRKSSAAQARMKNIASLATDERVPKKKKGKTADDMFGADDADWQIYRKINTAVPSSDEDEDLQQLRVVEQKLLAHDPSFTVEHTHASIASQRSALLTAFKPRYEEGDLRGDTRIHLSTERWRVCETWFSPSMAGVDSAGLGEVIQSILARFGEAEKEKMVQNVFLTGSASQFPNLIPRLQATLRPILPPEMPIQIQRANDPVHDAWRGMAAFAQTDEFASTGMTQAEYQEHGGERIKRWWGSNWNNAF